MRQIVNILVLVVLYGGIVLAQLFVVEKYLRQRPKSGVLLRIGLSGVHALIGYAFLLGIVILQNVIVHGDYRQGAFGPSTNLIPVAGGLFGLLVPWLPLLWGRPKTEAEWQPTGPERPEEEAP